MRRKKAEDRKLLQQREIPHDRCILPGSSANPPCLPSLKPFSPLDRTFIKETPPLQASPRSGIPSAPNTTTSRPVQPSNPPSTSPKQNPGDLNHLAGFDFNFKEDDREINTKPSTIPTWHSQTSILTDTYPNAQPAPKRLTQTTYKAPPKRPLHPSEPFTDLALRSRVPDTGSTPSTSPSPPSHQAHTPKHNPPRSHIRSTSLLTAPPPTLPTSSPRPKRRLLPDQHPAAAYKPPSTLKRSRGSSSSRPHPQYPTLHLSPPSPPNQKQRRLQSCKGVSSSHLSPIKEEYERVGGWVIDGS
ncbi:hypothetical protein EJ05DRAFT_299303 [Pseudovirgaria hyperparasitica]|uniref:Uncharacterized protein n=1 Tax=Pseudovirgaria hyperparasitica TaxID=470096 RepID=A0A6A6WD32_9PEZI|nr:uncharacterized protein EJ05DRAFT_299303 [Pseudovirgaria hyperparasitica]KAF2759477.1 hypothetical protein EJ05DRAFT_299303 [Pseudovirgaria hyperparasitica]